MLMTLCLEASRESEEATDADLVDRIRIGDEGAFREAYCAHRSAVLAAVLPLTRSRDEAEDAVQEAFARLWRNPDRFDPSRGSLRAFLAVDARNRALDAMRGSVARRRREDREGARVARVATTEDAALSAVVSARVRQLVERLRPEERSPILLAFGAEQSYREVAERLGLPEGTVKSRIRAGLGRLEGMLIAEGLDA
jgi:RNA polymerase sigma factor (sigma-70 family)